MQKQADGVGGTMRRARGCGDGWGAGRLAVGLRGSVGRSYCEGMGAGLMCSDGGRWCGGRAGGGCAAQRC